MNKLCTPTELRQQLRARLKQAQQGGTALVAPGVSDGYGARMVQQMGFEAIYMTGNGVSASLLGRPDVGLVDLSLMSGHARRIAACVNLPVICDADTGYGNVVGVRRTIEEFEAAGVAAIHMEDQISPKRCSQLPGARSVLPFQQAVAKVEAAVAARKDDQFVIIARTDSVGAEGLDAGIQRVLAFEKAGADAVFVELKAHDRLLDDIHRITDALTVPCIFNMDAGGPLLGLPSDQLHKHGIALAIYPALLRNAVGFAMREALQHLQADGHTLAAKPRQLSAKEYNDCLGLPEIENWELKFPD
jgi:2-methylisocitrate lyase-like PEP mutase family enzyme